jgi:hypothetical protein
MPFNHVLYEDALLTISTAAELAILLFVIKEGRKVVTDVNEIRDAASGTVYSDTDDLTVGSRVHVLEPQPGIPRDKWQYGPLLYVIREVDKLTNRAVATPVLPPQGLTPTVSGPMSGPHSPFTRSGSLVPRHQPLFESLQQND